MVEKKGYKPEDVPEAMKCVHAEVLRVDCPNTIARLAAGQHQRQQHDTMDVNTADILKMMVQGSERWKQQKDSPYVPDAQLYVILQSMGVVKESALKKAPKSTKKSPEAQLVCLPS